MACQDALIHTSLVGQGLILGIRFDVIDLPPFLPVSLSRVAYLPAFLCT